MLRYFIIARLNPVNQSTCKPTVLLEYKIERDLTTTKYVFISPFGV